VTASVAQALAPGHELAARAFASEGTTHFDAGLGTDDVNRQRLTSLSLESRNKVDDRWSSLLRVARGTDDIDTRGGFPSSFRTEQDQASWQNDVRVPGGTAIAGIEYRRERVTSTTEYAETARTIRSVFGGYSGAFGAHLVQGSVRRDDNSQFGDRTTGSIGYGYRITPSWRVSASTATAFKAPSFNDLYFVSPFFSGNPDLKPERSTSREAAIRYVDGPYRASLTLFENRIRDLIAVDPTFTTVVNVNEARIRGGTLALAADAANHRFKAELTRANPIDLATGHVLVRRAKTFGSLSVNSAAGPWRWGGEVVGSSERFDSVTNAPSSRLAGYALVSLRAAYAITPQWTVSARWNNVFDKTYTLVRGYNTPGSNAFVMLEYAS
jgi:vitamin B12 transporter